MQKSYSFSYSDILLKMLSCQILGQSKDISNIEPLAFLPYSRELSLKNEALYTFWEKNRLPGKPDAILASPKPRHYRTTTKRRFFFKQGVFHLGFLNHHEADRKLSEYHSMLEPKEHEDIYWFVSQKINTPGFSKIAPHLTYVIIRGSYTEFCVIFNVDRMNGLIIRNLRALADGLRAMNPRIMSSFIFCDPSRSDYYLEKRQEGGESAFKKLFGPDTIRLRVKDLMYLFGPISFSQINQSMIPVLLDSIAHLCASDPKGRLIDLYCGYGLFALYLGGRFNETYAIDVDSASIDCARMSARHTARKGERAARMHFRRAPISPSSLGALLPMAGTCSETILLDPPRNGPGNGVISFCARRGASRIVHLFCDIDRLPIDLQQWQRGGYRIASIVPFDLFPGTPNLEVAVLLEPVGDRDKSNSSIF